VSESREVLLSKLGFRLSANGPYEARPMMLEDLRGLFAEVPADPPRVAHAQAVIDWNVLADQTEKTAAREARRG
jgi:hypothetical protein